MRESLFVLQAAALFLVAISCSSMAAAQRAPIRGVVWDVPADPAEAITDLHLMHLWGIEAVRTMPIRSDSVLTVADTLGLQIFQDFPITGHSAASLQEKQQMASELADSIVARARNHPSARHFGLAQWSDTSDPDACVFFAHMAERLRRLPDSQVYYTSIFVESDRCAWTVDFVLLDVQDTADPVRVLQRWTGHHPDTPAAVGAMGLWVDEDAHGLLQPHSAESQARYMETHLPRLLENKIVPPAVFVYRWRDAPQLLSLQGNIPFLNTHTYGLFATDGSMRPAADVVRTVYQDSLRLFTFSVGTTPQDKVPWSVLSGWLLFFLVASCYYFFPTFSTIISRYFLAHSFYQDSIRKSRNVSLNLSIVLLVVVSLATGIVGTIFLQYALHTRTLHHLFEIAPVPVQRITLALTANVPTLIITLSLLYALGTVAYATMVSLPKVTSLNAAQVLLISLCTQWPRLLLVPVALAAETTQPPIGPVIPIVGAVWILVELWVTIRSLWDIAIITTTKIVFFLLLSCARLLPALLIIAIVLLLVSPQANATLKFLWHLTLRS